MKDKKIKKLAKQIFTEINNNHVTKNKPQYDVDISMKKESRISDLTYCPYNKDVSDKFIKFVTSMLKFNKFLKVEVEDRSLSIFCHLDDIYRDTNTSNLKSKYKEENTIHINIYKGLGFTITKDYGTKTSFFDENMYSLLLDAMKERYNILNKEYFDDIVDEVIVKTKLSRESNLDTLV